MCIITATAIASALGIGIGASAAGAAGIGTAGVIAGVANTVLAAGALAGIAGSATSVFSSYQQGKQQQAYYNYQAQVAQENAKIAEGNAAMERQQGIEEARLQRMKTLQNVASQQTAMAANGIDVTQGTSLDVIEDTAAMGELDALQTSYNYERKALSYEAQANNFRNQANLDVIAGQNAYSAGRMNALSSGLAGIGNTTNVALKWYGYNGENSNNGLSFGTKRTGMRIDSAYNNLG